MIDRRYYVYAYFRLDGVTPCYIGKGKGERWQHRGKTGRNRHFLNIRNQARAQGFELPVIKLAENLTDAAAIQLERDLILLVGRATNGGPLVNLTDGGDGTSGYRYTDEQREAHGAIRRGRKLTPEWRTAISNGLKSRAYIPTAEHRKAISDAQKGRRILTGWWSTEEGRAKQRANNPGHIGHHHSAETREVIRRATIRQFASAKARKTVRTSAAWASRNSVRYQAVA